MLFCNRDGGPFKPAEVPAGETFGTEAGDGHKWTLMYHFEDGSACARDAQGKPEVFGPEARVFAQNARQAASWQRAAS